jgi:hypothetical protein
MAGSVSVCGDLKMCGICSRYVYMDLCMWICVWGSEDVKMCGICGYVGYVVSVDMWDMWDMWILWICRFCGICSRYVYVDVWNLWNLLDLWGSVDRTAADWQRR